MSAVLSITCDGQHPPEKRFGMSALSGPALTESALRSTLEKHHGWLSIREPDGSIRDYCNECADVIPLTVVK